MRASKKHTYIYRVSPFVASSLVCEKKKVTCVIIDPVACASRIIVDLDQGILGRRCLFHLLDPCHDFLMENNNQLTCAAPELSCVCKTALLLSSLTASLLLASIAVLSSLHWCFEYPAYLLNLLKTENDYLFIFKSPLIFFNSNKFWKFNTADPPNIKKK